MLTSRTYRDDGRRPTKGKRPGLKPSYKRWKLDNLLCAVRNVILNHKYEVITAEDVGIALRAKTHLVRQCFHKLNLEGLLSLPGNDGPHDSHRNNDLFGGPWRSAWVATLYRIRRK